MIRKLYFDWLYDIVCGDKFSQRYSYRKLLHHLDGIEFTWLIPMDENRAEKGMSLRRHFILDQGYQNDDEYDEMMLELERPCSVLEMMIALASDCEHIMDDFLYAIVLLNGFGK